jgi:hypothetical protein
MMCGGMVKDAGKKIIYGIKSKYQACYEEVSFIDM